MQHRGMHRAIARSHVAAVASPPLAQLLGKIAELRATMRGGARAGLLEPIVHKALHGIEREIPRDAALRLRGARRVRGAERRTIRGGPLQSSTPS